MTDFRDLLNRAAEPEGEWAVDRQALVAAGHRRVARRRAAAITCAVVIVAAASVVGLTTLLGRDDPRSLVTDDRQEAGSYSEVRVPVAEVERRCSLVLNSQRGSDDEGVRWVAGRDSEGRGVSATLTSQVVENREGHTVPVVPEGERWPADGGSNPGAEPGGTGGIGERADRSADCLIPEESMLDQLDTSHREVPDTDDHAAVLADCSTRTGYDVRSWTVLAAVAAFGTLDAVAMSDNGYVVFCSIDQSGVHLTLDDRRYLDDEGQVALPSDDEGPTDPDRYPAPEETWCQGTDQGAVECGLSGVLPGLPDGYRIALSLPDGAVATSTTHRGAFAMAFETTELTDGYPVVVSTADGDSCGGVSGDPDQAMIDSAPGRISTTAGASLEPGSTPRGSPSPPTGTGTRAVARTSTRRPCSTVTSGRSTCLPS